MIKNIKSKIMWNNISSLTGLATVIQWIAIGMVFFGGLLQLGKFFVDKRISILKEQKQNETEIVRLKTEQELNGQIDSLKVDLSSSKSRIMELNEKTKFVDPYTQPIQSASATVFINIKSKEKINSHYMDSGGLIAFGKGDKEVLTLAAPDCYGISIDDSTVNYKGVFSLDAYHSSIGKNLTFLNEAEFIQILFSPIDNEYYVKEGKVVCTFNGNARIEFLIPEQMSQNKYIFIRNLESAFEKVFK
jgi:hypothetical protein